MTIPGFEQFAAKTLLAIAGFLGVQSLSSPPPTWEVIRPWHDQNGTLEFEASSKSVPQSCALPENIDRSLYFPTIIHGAHEIYLDGKLINSYGDPSFKSVRAFYGAPAISCRELAGKELRWKVTSYSTYFARISNYPEIRDPLLHPAFYSEVLNALAPGGLALIGFFAFVVFWGKVPNQLTLSITFSNLLFAGYFLSSIAGLIGYRGSMLTAHKFADISLWSGVIFLFNAFRIEGLISNRMMATYFSVLVGASACILLGQSGDAVQFGTTIPFFFSPIPLMASLGTVIGRARKKKFTVISIFQIMSILFFALVAMNDILVVLGLISGYMLLAAGSIGSLMFFAFAVNEEIRTIYRERDFLRQNLEAQVEIQTRELRTKTSDLESAMKALKTTQAELIQSAKLASLGTLSASIAHEINNSLNYVNGAVKPLDKIIKTEEGVEQIRKRSQPLITLMTEGLQLTFAIIKSLKSYSGINQAEFKEISFKEVTESVLTILKSKLRNNIRVMIDIPDSLQAHASVVGMNQVLMNLLGNAIDAMPHGGELKVIATDCEDLVRVSVSDSGTGIPDNIKARIFEPFFTTKSVGSGTGLGLHIVKLEIERHKGKLTVDSTEGKGTTFSFTIPKRPANSLENRETAA